MRPSGVRLAQLGAELLLDMRDNGIGAAQHAGDIGADRHSITADRLGLDHRIETGDLVHRHLGHAQILGDRIHRRDTHMPCFMLHSMQRRQHRRLFPVGRKLGQPVIDLGADFCR